MKKRIIALACLFAICLSMSLVPTVHAADLERVNIDNSVQRWTNTSVVTLTITFSSGTANCAGTIIGNTNTKKIEATFQMLKKNASGVFVPYYTWPKTTVNGDYLTWSNSCAVEKGVYRLQVTAIVTNTNNVSETVVTYCEKEYK